MGRHSSTTSKTSKTSRLRSPIVLLSALLVVVLVGWFVFDFVKNKLSATNCDATTVLNVAASPDIAAIMDQTGRKAAEEDPGGCYKVVVTSKDSATTAEALALSDSGGETPDVWVPESTLWLQRAQDKGAWNTPVTGTSVASSPVVFAVTEATADQLGWPGKTPTWTDVVNAASTRLGLPDPARDPVGVATLIGLREVTKAAPDPGAATTTLLRRLSTDTVAEAPELFTRLPGGGSPSELLAGFPASETALLRHNVKDTGAQLVAVYPSSPVPALDYPVTVLPKTTEAKRTAAQKFLGRLLAEEAATAFGDAGFRTPDGKVLRDRSVDKRTLAVPVERVPLPAPAELDQLLNVWAGVNLSARLQVLLDVSGSMAEPVPGTPFDRMTITLKAAEQGITLFKPTTKFGVWLFSTNLDGDKDYRELVPVRSAAEQLSAGALDTLRAVKAIQGGATGLYDTVLAAYQGSRQNWEAGRINIVVVLTDGKNDNASGLTREQLLAELAKLQDPRRPLQIIGIGIGPDVDPAELQAISTATGGQAFIAADPTKMSEVFYAALSKLICQPPTCKPGS